MPSQVRNLQCRSNLPVAIKGRHYILLSQAELAPTAVVIKNAVTFFLAPCALRLVPFINPQSKICNLKSTISNPPSTIPLPLSPLQLISENGEIVLLARLDQKEGLRGLLYTDNIICL